MRIKLMQYMNRWLDLITYIFFGTFVFSTTITLIAIIELNQESALAMLLKIIRYVVYIAFFFIISYKFIKKVYTKEAALFICVLLIITAVSMIISREKVIFIESLLFGAVYKCETRILLKISCSIQGFILGIVVVLATFNIIPNTILDFERMRYSLGFSWVSYAPNLLLFVALQYVVLRDCRITKKELFLLEMINIYMFIKTNTKTSFLMLTVILLLMLFYREKTIWAKEKLLLITEFKYWKLLPIICFGVAVSLPLYDSNTFIWKTLNSGLAGRLALSKDAIMNYGFKAFGQFITFQGYSVLGMEGIEYNYVDSSYLQILIRYGLLTTILLLNVYTIALKKTRKNNVILFFTLVFVAIFSIEEPFLFATTFNLLPLVAFCDEDLFSNEKQLSKAIEFLEKIKKMISRNKVNK